jgi:hypothetical protein
MLEILRECGQLGVDLVPTYPADVHRKGFKGLPRHPESWHRLAISLS